jgi:gliding motility-associated-like protein
LPTITGTLSACIGNTTQLTGSATAATNAWSSSDTSVATVSATGLVTGVSAGTTTITYTNSNGCQVTVIVTIGSLATATIAGTTSICLNATSPSITFTGANGAIPYTFTYTINGGDNQTITTTTGNSVTIAVPTSSVGVFTYALVSVSSAGLTSCSQTQTGSAVVTVNALPTATISGTTSICRGTTAVITFTGTPNAVVTYTINGGTNQTITLNATGTASITTSTLTANSTYALVSVASGTTTCNQTQTGLAIITIEPELTFNIDAICENSMLVLKVTDANFNTNDATYIWTQAATTVGTNATFNVDEYLAQNPSVTLPLLFSLSLDLNGCIASQNFTVENNPCRIIPRGISPNNDQLNDTFDLTGFGVQDIIIFNRYGTKVFSYSGNYTNQWKGQTDGGDELPDGTYFYSIYLTDGLNRTGWVYINREY